MAIGIGLDVGGTKVLGCAVTDAGEVVAEARLASPATKEALVDVLCACVEAVLADLGSPTSTVVGVGAGLPGLVDRAGVLHETANIHDVAGLDLPASLRPRLEGLLGSSAGPLVLVVDNDATCAAAGEHAFGAGQGVTDSITVTLGTGIGGGIVTAGSIVHGERNFAAEVGHMVVDPSGPRCGCGRRGCWERFASGTGLAYLARRAVLEGRAPGLAEAAGGIEALRAEQVVAAAAAGDPGAAAVVGEYADYLALGLGNLAELLDPGRIILGGGLAAAGSVLFPPAIARYEATCRRGSGPRQVPVVTASLGERAGAIGAAVLALGVLG